MCLSTNAKQLITASDKGVIYIWRLPVDLTAKLIAAKTTPKVSACPKKELSDVLGQISNVANLINNIPSQESQELPAWAKQSTPSKVISNSETKEVTRITQADYQKQESINDPPMVEANQPQIQSNEFENKPINVFDRFQGYYNPLADSSESSDEDSKEVLNNRQQSEYARRFIEDNQIDQVLRSQQDLNWNRQSVSVKFLNRMNTPHIEKEPAKQAADEDWLKDDEVTDIIDDHDIIAPLNTSLKKEAAQQPSRSLWTTEKQSAELPKVVSTRIEGFEESKSPAKPASNKQLFSKSPPRQAKSPEPAKPETKPIVKAGSEPRGFKPFTSPRAGSPKDSPKASTEINQAVQAEMDAIQQSLMRLSKVISKSKGPQKAKLTDDAANKITKSLSLWNSMI
jgi:hypothetical protein